MKILITHAFSTKNLGDGLLVDETLEMIEQAFGAGHEITLLAHYPETFAYDNVRKLRSAPNKIGYSLEYLKALKNIRDYDFIVAVGGGYFRYGYLMESIKTSLVHTPQMIATALSGRPSIYLPQSIGPLRGGTVKLFRPFFKKMDKIYLRDQRSVQEVNLGNVVRFPDLAALDVQRNHEILEVEPLPILQIRSVRGKVPAGIYDLEKQLGDFDSYIQSTTGGNNDIPATETLSYQRILSKEEYLAPEGPRRVVVAMRLHAALMALRAGHYVIHLSYERKGFGAFDDLGLKDYVFNVNNFDSQQVYRLAQKLLTSEAARAEYNQNIRDTQQMRSEVKNRLVADMQKIYAEQKKK